MAASHLTPWGETTHVGRLRGGLNDISSHVGGTRAAAAIRLERRSEQSTKSGMQSCGSLEALLDQVTPRCSRMVVGAVWM